MEARRLAYLQALDIQAWELRQPDGLTEQSAVEQPHTRIPPVEPIEAAVPPLDFSVDADGLGQYDWKQLQGAVRQCMACDLHKSRQQTVFGVGDEHAEWMIIGEAPGAQEDKLGEPFVGPAGKLLDQMLRAMGLERQTVYITNIIKCRPPGNRDPRPQESAACHAYLLRQIELLKPKLILAVGRVAAHHLLDSNETVGRLRGRPMRWGEASIPLLVTYHPAYLLHNPADKGKVWQDLQTAMTMMQENTQDN